MEASKDLIQRFEGSLEGRVCIVTGAGSGIGRATAEAMARAGADVALLGRNEVPLDATATLVEACGRQALVVVSDVVEPSQVVDAVIQTEELLGPIDVAVANAGVNAWGELEELTPEALRSALATNIEGVANLSRAVVPGMRRRGGGKLIVVASDNGRRPEAGGAGYVASKFGAVGFARSLAQELYGSAVGVHVIEPGCVDTEWYGPEEADLPRGRMLRADDVAYVALFLATLPRDVVFEESMILPRGLLAEPW